jgi:hypothetical protein
MHRYVSKVIAVSLMTTFACLNPGHEICTSLRAEVESSGTATDQPIHPGT